jgi:hypothetical protein
VITVERKKNMNTELNQLSKVLLLLFTRITTATSHKAFRHYDIHKMSEGNVSCYSLSYSSSDENDPRSRGQEMENILVSESRFAAGGNTNSTGSMWRISQQQQWIKHVILHAQLSQLR